MIKPIEKPGPKPLNEETKRAVLNFRRVTGMKDFKTETNWSEGKAPKSFLDDFVRISSDIFRKQSSKENKSFCIL